MIEYIRRLRKKRELGKEMADELTKREKSQGAEYIKTKANAKIEAELKATEEKNARLMANKAKPRLRYGKVSMKRSKKVSKQKKEEKKEIDPKKRDFMMYLGQSEELEELFNNYNY